ncbi:hypothetical protein KKG90_10985 [Candidatus Bipolaricaulota bacterium]|nr:hypothetical protein [Candidatus Bipolaricaulota bacterium]
MKSRYYSAAAILLLAVTACTSSQGSEEIHVGQLYLRSEVRAFGSEEHLFRGVDWIQGERIVGELHNERIPEWAKSFAIACVQWEEEFTRTVTRDSESGTPQTVIQHGHAEGWILVGDRPGQYHILELTIEFEGTVYHWIDAWDAPE